MREVFAIRLRVFVGEQGVPEAEEIDEHDRTDAGAVHALARVGGRAVGTGRWYVARPGCVAIGRMAVDAAARGTGAGAALLARLVAEAGARGFERAELNAQVHAIEFYAKHGFRDDGERNLDAGIVHQPMSRVIGRKS